MVTGDTIVSFRSIASTTASMAFLAHNILSLFIIKVSYRRALTFSLMIGFSFGLKLIIITTVTSIWGWARHTVIGTTNTNIFSMIKVMSSCANTLMSIRVNNFQIINTTLFTVGFIGPGNLAERPWAFRNTKWLIDQRATITICTDEFLLELKTDIGEL